MALIYCDDTFRGTYTMGTRANLPVRPEDAWFPASLDQTFRERFLAEPKADNIAAQQGSCRPRPETHHSLEGHSPTVLSDGQRSLLGDI
jgi:hypothetical protein